MNTKILLKNITVKVQTRYKTNKDSQVEKEWFVQNFNLMYEGKKINFKEIIINFDFIDADNPEFFLQPGQIIKVLDGCLEKIKGIMILKIFNFQQLSDEGEEN
ncbi:MAG: hypothetical protein Q8784_00690 [Vigna little leaf phytoplasma]|nr:hypothetical protein [Vigna little leaf phytoplasma]